MAHKRIERLNSLLKEVISEVIHSKVRNPDINKFLTITQVETTKDIKNAKVFVSIIGDEDEKNKTLNALKSAAGYIGIQAAQKVVLRCFPSLSFYIDDTVSKQMRIISILEKINADKSSQKNDQY